MRRKGRAIGIVVSALFVLIVTTSYYLDRNARQFGECRVVILSSIPSPSGSKSVVTFRKECGATTPSNTQASIALTGVAFSPEQAPLFLAVRGSQDILAAWAGENLIKIGLIPGEQQVYKRESRVGDVSINYE